MPAPWMKRPDITPERYEIEVANELRRLGGDLAEFTVTHRGRVEGMDGEYEMDAVARFTALGEARFMVLVECKLTGRPVEREVVQALYAKLQSTGAHKGIVFSTAGFQRGAIEYAEKHGIALVHFTDGTSAWGVKSSGPRPPRPVWAPEYAAWIIRLTPEGESHSRSEGELLKVLSDVQEKT